MSLLIHPGFHKTGTTWLQQQLFSDSRYFLMMFDHEEIDGLFIRPHDLEFSVADVASEVARRRAAAGSPVIEVISSENLSGQPFAGSLLSRTVAQRLADTCGPAKILLTVRAQLPITRSLYMQYLKRGGRLTIDKFLSYQPEPNYAWFNESVLKFGNLARCYGQLFGDENVLALPQELLARDRRAWLGHFFRFVIGAEPPTDLDLDGRERTGVSPPASGMPLLRTANLFREGPLNPNAIRTFGWLGDMLHRGAYRWKVGNGAAERTLNAIIRKRFSGQFAADNKLLQNYCPVDLRALGYEMEPDPAIIRDSDSSTSVVTESVGNGW